MTNLEQLIAKCINHPVYIDDSYLSILKRLYIDSNTKIYDPENQWDAYSKLCNLLTKENIPYRQNNVIGLNEDLSVSILMTDLIKLEKQLMNKGILL